ncbi:MAG: urease accessory protein UreE [Pseudomonadota bacterium]
MAIDTQSPVTLVHRVTATEADDTIELPFELRQKARQRIVLRSGREAFVKLNRGGVLRGGDCLASAGGFVVRIGSALEALSEVTSDDNITLARAAYHLGNRHVWVEIGRHSVRYQRDHVLDHMLERLDFRITHIDAPFEPEAGAYDGHSH